MSSFKERLGGGGMGSPRRTGPKIAPNRPTPTLSPPETPSQDEGPTCATTAAICVPQPPPFLVRSSAAPPSSSSSNSEGGAPPPLLTSANLLSVPISKVHSSNNNNNGESPARTPSSVDLHFTPSSTLDGAHEGLDGQGTTYVSRPLLLPANTSSSGVSSFQDLHALSDTAIPPVAIPPQSQPSMSAGCAKVHSILLPAAGVHHHSGLDLNSPVKGAVAAIVKFALPVPTLVVSSPKQRISAFNDGGATQPSSSSSSPAPSSSSSLPPSVVTVAYETPIKVPFPPISSTATTTTTTITATTSTPPAFKFNVNDVKVSSVSSLLLSNSGRRSGGGQRDRISALTSPNSPSYHQSDDAPQPAIISVCAPSPDRSPIVSGSPRDKENHHVTESLGTSIRDLVNGALMDIHQSSSSLAVAAVRLVESEEFVFCRKQHQQEEEETPAETAAAAYSVHLVDVIAEAERYSNGPSIGCDDEVNIGNCNCPDNDIEQFFPGFDLRKYRHHELFESCSHCSRRPSVFLCLHCFKSVCPSHVEEHYRQSVGGGGGGSGAGRCFLFLNELDLDHSYDRQLWCERCRRFTWKCTEAYEPLIEQILYTKGTYLDKAVRDVHVTSMRVQQINAEADRSTSSEVVIRNSLTTTTTESGGDGGGGTSWAIAAASTQGWRTTQEDAHHVFLLDIPCSLLQKASSSSSSSSRSMMCLCVFDGHGGDAVAKLVALAMEHHMRSAIQGLLTHGSGEDTQKQLAFEDAAAGNQPSHHQKTFFTVLFSRAFQSLDDSLRYSKEGRQGDFNCMGCTATIVGLLHEQPPLSSIHHRSGLSTIVVANLGDSGAAVCFSASSRTTLSNDGAAATTTAHRHALRMLTTPHRITDQEEISRIKTAGYSISKDGRIEGLLAVTRAFGDFDFKQCGGKGAGEQAVSCIPSVDVFSLRDLEDRMNVKDSKRGGRCPSPSSSSATAPVVQGWELSGFLVSCDGLWDSHKNIRSIEKLLSPEKMYSTSSSSSNSSGSGCNVVAVNWPPGNEAAVGLFLDNLSPKASSSSQLTTTTTISTTELPLPLRMVLSLTEKSVCIVSPYAEHDEEDPGGSSKETPKAQSPHDAAQRRSNGNDEDDEASSEESGDDDEVQDKGTDNCTIVLAMFAPQTHNDDGRF